MNDGQLLGPHGDVQQMKDMLMSAFPSFCFHGFSPISIRGDTELYKYAPQDIVTMMDDGKNPPMHPTRENIVCLSHPFLLPASFFAYRYEKSITL